jgi:hypothetical protein
MTRLAAIVVLAFALAGCGSGSNDNEAASSTTTSTTSTSPTTTSTSPPSMQTVPACMPPPSASTSPRKSSANENRETMYLTDVSLDQGEKCIAKVTFAFEQYAPGPGYQVSYQPADTAKIEDASGNPVEIAGDAFLVVKLNPAMTAKIDGDQVVKTYTGPRRIPGTDPIAEVVKTGDFEGVVTWVIGLDSKRSFTTKASDSQLVVEITRS